MNIFCDQLSFHKYFKFILVFFFLNIATFVLRIQRTETPAHAVDSTFFRFDHQSSRSGPKYERLFVLVTRSDHAASGIAKRWGSASARMEADETLSNVQMDTFFARQRTTVGT